MIEELKPEHITDFNGLWNRGPAETVPLDHFRRADNIRYLSGGFATRYGTSLSIAVPEGVRRWFPYSIEGQADRIIYLDTTGKIFDSLFPGVPILDIATMTDFSMVVMNDRAYLSPHNRKVGQAGEFVYVYQGAGVPARLAAGNPPSGFSLIASTGAAGNIEPGLHLYAVAFETDSGFITRPGPGIWASHEAVEGFGVELTNIPVGPAGTVRRHILATRFIQDFDGNQENYELFFVEGAALNDNIAVEAQINFYDSQLVRSADYLIDQMNTIPAVLGFTTFAGSLVGWAPNTEPASVYFSKAGEPESISLIEGGLEVEPMTGGGVRSCVAYRGQTLIIHKAGRIYSTMNNGEEPVYWDAPLLDSGIGSTVFGVAVILDEEGNTTDKYVVATKKGLIAYDGTFSNVVSTKIEDLWNRITKTAFDTIQVALDPIDELIYVAVPLDGADSPNAILFCDYSNGLDVNGVRWAIWTFAGFNPTSIGIDVNDDGEPVFKIASSNGNIYFLDPDVVSDNLVAIPNPTFQTAYIGDEGVAVNFYGGVRLRVFGTGVLDLFFSGLDDTVSVNPPSINLALAPGRYPQSNFGLQSQKARLRGSTDNFGEKFSITRITIYHAPFWAEEPL